ncbi:hypothetical protein ISCGN_014209 [Ixodes scapularis]
MAGTDPEASSHGGVGRRARRLKGTSIGDQLPPQSCPPAFLSLGLGILAPPNMLTDAAWVGCSFRATPSGPPGTAGADPPDTPLRNRGPLPQPSDRVLTNNGDKWRRLGLGV